MEYLNHSSGVIENLKAIIDRMNLELPATNQVDISEHVEIIKEYLNKYEEMRCEYEPLSKAFKSGKENFENLRSENNVLKAKYEKIIPLYDDLKKSKEKILEDSANKDAQIKELKAELSAAEKNYKTSIDEGTEKDLEIKNLSSEVRKLKTNIRNLKKKKGNE